MPLVNTPVATALTDYFTIYVTMNYFKYLITLYLVSTNGFNSSTVQGCIYHRQAVPKSSSSSLRLSILPTVSPTTSFPTGEEKSVTYIHAS